MNSFFQKWQFPIELIFVVDRAQSSDSGNAELKAFRSNNKHLQIHILENHNRRGRGASVRQGLQIAKGRFTIVGSADLNIPLAEYFNALQDFTQDPAAELIVGNRFDLKKPRHGEKKSWHQAMENAEREKFQLQHPEIMDPTCSFFAIKHQALQKLIPELQPGHWFYTPAIIQLAKNKGLQLRQKPVISHDTLDSRFGLGQALRTLFLR